MLTKKLKRMSCLLNVSLSRYCWVQEAYSDGDHDGLFERSHWSSDNNPCRLLRPQSFALAASVVCNSCYTVSFLVKSRSFMIPFCCGSSAAPAHGPVSNVMTLPLD